MSVILAVLSAVFPEIYIFNRKNDVEIPAKLFLNVMVMTQNRR